MSLILLDNRCRWERHVSRPGRSVIAGSHRGDQEALDAIREHVEPRIVELPRRYRRLRLDGPAQPGDAIYHWTGPSVKDAIRWRVGLAGPVGLVKQAVPG